MVKSSLIVINMISVQNLLAPKLSVEKTTLPYFLCLAISAISLNFSHISIKLKNEIKKFNQIAIILASPEASRGNFLPYLWLLRRFLARINIETRQLHRSRKAIIKRIFFVTFRLEFVKIL